MAGFMSGRRPRVATYVDGALITDFNDQLNTVELSRFAVEEIDVITGGFNAEWGHAQSGIINIVTREGGREYHGNVRYTSDELEIEQSYGFNNLQASIGGPIVPDKLTARGRSRPRGGRLLPGGGGFNPAVGARRQLGSTGDPPGNRGGRTWVRQADSVLPWDAKARRTHPRDQLEVSGEPRLSQFSDDRESGEPVSSGLRPADLRHLSRTWTSRSAAVSSVEVIQESLTCTMAVLQDHFRGPARETDRYVRGGLSLRRRRRVLLRGLADEHDLQLSHHQ
jgi:hypothetical protein